MRLLTRSLNALFALWFAVVLGDPGVLHTCAMHEGGHGGSHVVSAGGHAAMHSAASHAAGMHATGAGGGAEHHDPAPACTCVGHCCAVSAAAPLSTRASVDFADPLAVHRHALAEPLESAPAAPGLRLPFANGPPRA